jgi:hypothetical protein
MSRQTAAYEKVLFDIVREHNCGFYYDSIIRDFDSEQYKLKVHKEKEEMVGKASVIFQSGDRIEYEIKYNRISNLRDGYTLIVPGIKTV